MHSGDDDRFVGQAQVPLPVTAIPYTEPLYLPPPPKRRRGLFYAAIATIMLLICVIGVLVGLSFSRDLFAGTPFAPTPPSPTPSPTPAQAAPKAVAERFLQATVAGDQAIVQENLCRLLRGNGGLNSGSNQDWLTRLVGFKVGDESITGPAASVDVELTVPLLGNIPFDLYLIQEDKAWRVCGLGPS